MAINYTISYTFSPNTTISSSNVNTNTSDNANTWTGLEALTKTFAKLKVDVDPTTALEVSTKQYVDHYSTYRRPVLQWSSTTAVNMETGINGTSGQAQVLFPDGNLRTDSTTSRINLSISQVAALSGTAQSGLRTGTVANNTWYVCYAVKTSDNTSNFVMVADTVLPLQANYATLNSNFGTSSWVFLGAIRYGNGADIANQILKFNQVGNFTVFGNIVSQTNLGIFNGMELTHSASATTLTWSYAAGTSGAVIPDHITTGIVQSVFNNGAAAGLGYLSDSARTFDFQTTYMAASAGVHGSRAVIRLNGGAQVNQPSAGPCMILLVGFFDPVLGVGSNPIL